MKKTTSLVSILFCICSAARAAEVSNHSFARPDVTVKNLSLDLTVDFTAKKLSGRASLEIDNQTGSSKLYLDTRDLTIKNVTLGTGKEEPARFVLGDSVKYLGRPLVIDIQPATKTVNIDYETDPNAAALQWLTPAQTAGKKMPFLLTQSQSILARTWVPCQDTPEVRMTYSAKIKVPAGMLAIMSAENNPRKNRSGVYTFRMPQPIPSYLLALAVGDIAFEPITARAGVYAEPPMVKKAAWEFAELGKMMTAAEKLYGPYRWGRYDVLVLPTSFPYGGMENPRLTFVSPTIVAGDRSLVAVLTHELAHSWSGNLVTNASWDDFWLNEGFTTYFERRVTEAMKGKELADMQALLGLQKLQETMADPKVEASDKHLHLDLKDRDPDDAVGDVAYEKGALFLRTIEQTVGREKWDAFLNGYFSRHAFHSMTTERFLADLDEAFLKKDPALKERLRIDAWVYGPTIPTNAPKIETAAFEKVDKEIQRWTEGTPPKKLRTSGWVTQQWLRFLNGLPKTMTPEQMSGLDRAFNFTKHGNAEILTAWLQQAVRNRYEAAYPKLETFLISVGRRKYLKPLYTELSKTEDGMQRALKIYTKARPGYHSVSAGTIDGILKWNPKS